MNVHTLREVAKHFQTRPNTVGDWKKSGCDELRKPPYDTDAIARWAKANGKKLLTIRTNEPDDLSEQKIRADIRLKKIKCRLGRYQLAVKRGELVLAADTEQVLVEQANAFRTEILNLEHQYDAVVGLETREQAKAKLRKIATDVLKRLSLGQSAVGS